MPDNDVLDFDRICAIEPEISRLYEVAECGGLAGDTGTLWVNYYLPEINDLVGPIAKNPLLRTGEARQIVIDALFKVVHARSKKQGH